VHPACVQELDSELSRVDDLELWDRLEGKIEAGGHQLFNSSRTDSGGRVWQLGVWVGIFRGDSAVWFWHHNSTSDPELEAKFSDVDVCSAAKRSKPHVDSKSRNVNAGPEIRTSSSESKDSLPAPRCMCVCVGSLQVGGTSVSRAGV
jgi:hypothetical protein